jgi:hypothetical protein
MPASPESSVDITWLSVTNVYLRVGPLGILTDGYVTRIPQSAFVGEYLQHSRAAYRPDSAAVARMLTLLGGPGVMQALLNTMRVVRWNHSGDHAVNPDLHDPRELAAVPTRDSTGGLRPGVLEDFPNGGGSRAYLITVPKRDGRLTIFFSNTGSPADLDRPIIIRGTNFGAPIDNLRAALRDAGLASVDLWIAGGGAPLARLVLPVLRPKAYLPVHWDDYFSPLEAGVAKPYADPALESLLDSAGVTLVRPAQYLDRWRLDRGGVHAVANDAQKRALGLPR